MRCDDCLPLIEEYFDGEVTGQTAATVRAHLSTCADCSAALDALSFEQEVYARYDRGGLEVTPDLWARVSAEIARTPPVSESPTAGRPFLSRARERFAAALGALAVRPALASSLALLVVAATAGTLWLARRTQSNVPTHVAVNTPATTTSAVIPTAPDNNNGIVVETPTGGGTVPVNDDGAVPAAYEPRGAREAEVARVNAPRRDGGDDFDVETLLNESSAPKEDSRVVKFRQDEHAPVDDAALLVNASAPVGDLVANAARPLDPDEKDVARHVERAQMLLRSIKNTRAADAGAAPDMTYEKSLSRKLLAENSTLKLEAEVKGDKQTQQVLDKIEPFLLDIANLGEKPSREEVRSIGERVRQNEIVAALEVY